MLAISIELLSGRYVATSYNDRERAEWPPHPARLFSALVATWADGDAASAQREAELRALRWLERLSAPQIISSSTEACGARDVVAVFVPVNDVSVVSPPDTDKLRQAEGAVGAATDERQRIRAMKALEKLQAKHLNEVARAIAPPTRISKTGLKAAGAVLPERRTRQARTFPSVAPASRFVHFVWPDIDVPIEFAGAFDDLLRRLVRLGHSSSLVHARRVSALEENRGDVRFIPSEDGSELLRWVSPGQVDRLEASHALHQGVEARVLPATFVRYRSGGDTAVRVVSRSVFGDQERDWLILARVGGPRLPSTSVPGLARQMRRALMSYADQPVAEVISGHQANGAASELPHVAVVPLPNVAHEHADGAILGVALVLPRDLAPGDRAQVMRAIGRWERSAHAIKGEDAPLELSLGAAGVLELSRVEWGEHKNKGLRVTTWSCPAKRWATATPVALDKNPGDLHDRDPSRRARAFHNATAIMAEAFQRIGLPPPLEIDVLRSCVLPGTAKPRSFPRFPLDEDRPQRVLVHVRVCFAEVVSGPLLVGAGRFQGLGLFRPLLDGDS